VIPGAEQNLLELAERLRQRGDAPIVEAGFLNYTQPLFRDAVARCVEQGATHIVVAPYFLVAGKFVVEDLPAQIESVRAEHPSIDFVVANVIGFHERLADAVLDCAAERRRPVGWPGDVSSPTFNGGVDAAGPADADVGAPPAALLLIAHGSPRPEANADIERVAELVRTRGTYERVQLCYLDCNDPDIASGVDLCVSGGAKEIVGVPYFLHSGKHFQRDIPHILEEARQRHPNVHIVMSDYVGHRPVMADIVMDRVLSAI